MATRRTSAVEESVLPTPEPTPSEPEQEMVAVGEEGEAAAPAIQEPEKPDVRAILKELPDEEREAVLGDVYGDRLRKAEQSAQDKAYARLQGEQHRQQQANQQLRQTLANIDNAPDDNTRAQHIDAYAYQQAVSSAESVKADILQQVQQTLGISDGKHRTLLTQIHEAAADAHRVATFGDYLKAAMGEKFVAKTQKTKEETEEIAALVEEAVGKRLAGQVVTPNLGPGEVPRTADVASAQGQEATRAAFKAKHGFDPL